MAPKQKQMSLDRFAFTRTPKTPSSVTPTSANTPAPPSTALPPSSSAHATPDCVHPPPAKRQRVEVPEHSVDTPDASALSRVLRQRLSPHKTTIPPREHARHARFVSKLVGEDGTSKGEAGKSGTKTPATAINHSPLELQVVALKRKHPGVVLMVEVGYKFRFFGDDAEIAAKVCGKHHTTHALDNTLQECNVFCYQDRNFLTASVPVPRLHVYVRKLVQAGHKVGIVRQTETAAIKSQGANRGAPFTRQLTAVYTRATLEAGALDEVGQQGEGASREGGGWSNQGLSAYLVVVAEGGGETGACAVETSTGDVYYAQFRDGVMREQLEALLMHMAPAELLLVPPLSPATAKLMWGYASSVPGLRCEQAQAGWSPAAAMEAVRAWYQEAGEGAMDEHGTEDALRSLPPLALVALAAAVQYLKPLGMASVLRMGATFRPFSEAAHVKLSSNALSQLEVLRNSDDGGERGSLVWLMDRTRTAFGGRLLRAWIGRPLNRRTDIIRRLDAVQCLVDSTGGGAQHDVPVLRALADALDALPDLERSITRILHKTASPSAFAAALRALASLPTLLGIKAVPPSTVPPPACGSALLNDLLADAVSEDAVRAANDMLEGLDEAAAAADDKLNMFTSRDRFAAVHQHMDGVAAAEASLQSLLPGLATQAGVRSLAYVHVANQGEFLLELPVDKAAPKAWQRVCSTKKVHRYRPPSVQKALTALEVAREHHSAACEEAWRALQAVCGTHYVVLRRAVKALAQLDALLSMAHVAQQEGYVRPEVLPDDAPTCLRVELGRHPVLDALRPGEVVPNDVALTVDGRRVMLITGPNMGGKSSYIRMAALITIMAQVGCYVPAASAKLTVFRAIFTRMGANDNLQLGRSTFLEELSEAATILNAADQRSLVVMDELGRGTSTQDGVAVALASLQWLVQHNRSLTLFVTHYPQMGALAEEFPCTVSSHHMAFLEHTAPPGAPGDTENRDPCSVVVLAKRLPQVTLLYKLVPGIAPRSFGLNVARLAQLPEVVVNEAARIAAQLEVGVQRARQEWSLVARLRDAVRDGDDQALLALQQG